MSRVRRAAFALLPSAALWSLLIAFGFVYDAGWPDTWDSWRFFLVSALAAEYFLMKATVIVMHWHGWDSLTATLTFTNGLLAFAFFLQMASFLWPLWATKHETTISYVAYVLMLGFIAGIIELALVPPSEPAEGE